MINTLVLSILAVAQVGGIALPKRDVARVAAFPAVKTIAWSKGGSGTVGGQEAAGWIELSAPAPCVTGCGTFLNGTPAGGMPVHLTSSNAAVANVQDIRVSTRQTRATFTVLTSGVSAATPVTISAWSDGSAPQTTILNVLPTSLNGIRIDQASVLGGTTAHGTIMFTGTPGPAGGVKATLTSKNPDAVQVPASVSLDAGKIWAEFDVKTSGVQSDIPVTIVASYGDIKVTSSLTVTPAVLISFNRVPQLNGVAPPSGAVIQLTSADPAHASVPPTVTIPAGAKAISHTVVTEHPDFSDHHVAISATYRGVTKSDDYLVWKNRKPDFVIQVVIVKDRFGSSITHPQDAQPYKVCASIQLLGLGGAANYLYPSATMLGVSYLSPDGTGVSSGHEFDVPVTFASNSWLHSDDSARWPDLICSDMPGIPQSGGYADVTLNIDSRNTTDETNEGNNTTKLRITRQ
jgi:hypothetical protein